MREAAIIKNGAPVDVIVLADGDEGDAMLSDSCVEITDLNPKPGLDTGWTYVDGAFVAPPVPPLTAKDIKFVRHAAYAAPDGPDAIFLQWQRGDATEQNWLDSVQAVKDAHPYPQET